jgi:pimeloyl-ACP methyl ester carboxylesterase
MSETSVSIDGIRAPLLELGPSEATEGVVFVHGNPGSIRDWENLARGVANFGRALAMDMPDLAPPISRRISTIAFPVTRATSENYWRSGACAEPTW